jgi:hypothetical protein
MKNVIYAHMGISQDEESKESNVGLNRLAAVILIDGQAVGLAIE